MLICPRAILGFIASAVKYASQNLEKIMQYVTGENLSPLNLLTGNRYGGPTALILLVINIFLFHGLTSLSSIFAWLPVFISVTLLATVNVAPGVMIIATFFGEVLLALIELGRPVRTPGDQVVDMEQAQGPLLGMAEHPTFGYRRYRSIPAMLSYIHGLPEARNLEPHDEEIDESVELDGSSLSTTTEVRLLVQPLDPVPDMVPQYIALAPIGSMDEQSVCFPQAPQDHPLEMPYPIMEESSFGILVPG
jgi:hypothetical protein